MNELEYGTKVRITKKDSYFYGRDAWIKGDNWIERIEPIVDPGVIYFLFVLTPDGESVENAWARPVDLEVVA